MVPAMRMIFVGLAIAACGGSRSSTTAAPVQLREVALTELRLASEFNVISDRVERSRALFVEAARVITHPRCTNCHPDGDAPHQGMEMRLHDPPVVRGPADTGVPGNECVTCHQDRNQDLVRVPGAPNWHLAPRSMAWDGKSHGYICNQLKDPVRNGGKTLAQIVEHSAHDKLVGWGWFPGAERAPAPGTQEQFGELMAAWVATGAECPSDNGGSK